MDIRPSALGSALQGIQRGLNGARENAHNIATATSSGSLNSITESVIGLKQNVVQVQASAKVVSTVDEILNSLLNDLSDRG